MNLLLNAGKSADGAQIFAIETMPISLLSHRERETETERERAEKKGRGGMIMIEGEKERGRETSVSYSGFDSRSGFAWR